MMIIGRSLKHVEVIARLDEKGKRFGRLVDAGDEVRIKVGQRADQRCLSRRCLRTEAQVSTSILWRGAAAVGSPLPSLTPKASALAAPTTAWTTCRGSAPIRHIHQTWAARWVYSVINSQPTPGLYTNPLENPNQAHLGSQSIPKWLLNSNNIHPQLALFVHLAITPRPFVLCPISTMEEFCMSATNMRCCMVGPPNRCVQTLAPAASARVWVLLWVAGGQQERSGPRRTWS